MSNFKRIVIASNRDGERPELEQAARTMQADIGTASVRTIHVPGAPHERHTLDSVLSAAASHDADLLILGARSHVFASRAAMMAPCPVLMVPDDTILATSRVLVPVDFSRHSQLALRTGAELAAACGGETACLFVETEESPWHMLPDEQAEHEKKVERLRLFARAALGGSHPVRCSVEPVEHSSAVLKHVSGLSLPHAIQGADVAATIAHIAERDGASLLVIGTRGRSRSTAILLGSVTEKVIQFARCPVLAVRKPGENLGLLDLLFGGPGASAIA
jgi:nucleotide-binding universal stress UspA family protein